MTNGKLLGLTGLLCSLAVVTLQGCGSDDDDDGGGSTAGTGGKGGTTSSGGSAGSTAGSGGKAGSTSSGGSGGSTGGSAGKGGTSGGGTSAGGDTGSAGDGAGGGGAQTVCDMYCAEFAVACESDFDADYTDEQDCLDTCAGWDEGTQGQTGDTQWCRLDHTRNVATLGASHCDHAKEMPTAQCVP